MTVAYERSRLDRLEDWVEEHVPRLYHAFWRTRSWVRHPRRSYLDWRHARRCPQVGGQVLWHYEGPYEIVSKDGDDLMLRKPTGEVFGASWYACCDPVGTPIPNDEEILG